MAQQGKFVLDNITFDLITILHEKSKALEAYDKYLRDPQGNDELRQAIEQIRNDDQRHIEQLQQHLGRVLGKERRAA